MPHTETADSHNELNKEQSKTPTFLLALQLNFLWISKHINNSGLLYSKKNIFQGENFIWNDFFELSLIETATYICNLLVPISRMS